MEELITLENALETICKVVELLDELDSQFEKIPDYQSKNDMQISDLYHYIENQSISTKGCYRIVKKLKERLILRRNFKETLELLRTFNNNKGKLISIDNRKLLLAELNKTKKNLQKDYRCRIYSSPEEIKEFIES